MGDETDRQVVDPRVTGERTVGEVGQFPVVSAWKIEADLDVVPDDSSHATGRRPSRWVSQIFRRYASRAGTSASVNGRSCTGGTTPGCVVRNGAVGAVIATNWKNAL